MQFGMGHLAVSIDISVLIHATNALDGSHVERVLRAQIAGMCGFDFATGLIIVLFLFQRLNRKTVCLFPLWLAAVRIYAAPQRRDAARSNAHQTGKQTRLHRPSLAAGMAGGDPVLCL